MRLRGHRRNVVVLSSSADPPDLPVFRPKTRIRRLTRIGVLITLVGMMRLARAARPRWRPLLIGGACTVAGLVMLGTPWAGLIFPGLLSLSYCALVPVRPDADHRRLEHELAEYSTRAQRDDIEATLDRYPDTVTRELRDILTSQATRS
jgi:hypothetical protein